jgi:hypothetical protein
MHALIVKANTWKKNAQFGDNGMKPLKGRPRLSTLS